MQCRFWFRGAILLSLVAPTGAPLQGQTSVVSVTCAPPQTWNSTTGRCEGPYYVVGTDSRITGHDLVFVNDNYQRLDIDVRLTAGENLGTGYGNGLGSVGLVTHLTFGESGGRVTVPGQQGAIPGLSMDRSTSSYDSAALYGTAPAAGVYSYMMGYRWDNGDDVFAVVANVTVVAASPPAPPPSPEPPPPPAPVPSPGVRSLPFTVSESGVSGERTYRFALSSRTLVSAALSGMNRDIDCRVNGSACTNRGGTRDDSWSGELGAGTHGVTVYPYGGGSGDWTLTVTGQALAPPPSPSRPPASAGGSGVKRGVNVSAARAYILRLPAAAEVSVELTGLTMDFDCKVGDSPCSNRGGTADDSWRGTLAAGNHKIVVYPYGSGSGNYTLGVDVLSSAGGGTGTITRTRTLVDERGTGVSGERTHSFTLEGGAEVSVLLSELTRDFDCRVNGANCTNRANALDDSWSGVLGAGAHRVRVWPYRSGTGNYRLTVTATETLAYVASPMAAIGRICQADEEGNAIEDTCQTIYGDQTTVTADPGAPNGARPGQGTPGPPQTPQQPPTTTTPASPARDANNNGIVDHWQVVVTEDACSENFDLNDRLGTKYGGPNTERRTHGGVDIQADPGDRVLAWRSGTVARVWHDDPEGDEDDYNPACGHGVDIRHDNGWVSRYCHFQAAPALTVRATINAGALVGLAGSSGNSSGPHAHISVIAGPESRVQYFDHVDEGGRPTDDEKDDDGC